MHHKFEYIGANVEIQTAAGFIQYLNDMGEKGWELISSAPSQPENHVFCIWKRQKSAIISPIRG